MNSAVHSKTTREAFDWLYSKTTEADELENVVKKRNEMWERLGRFSDSSSAQKKSQEEQEDGPN